MQHEKPANSEQKYPQWEMQLSWGDLLVAMLERKAFTEEDTSIARRQYAISEHQQVT